MTMSNDTTTTDAKSVDDLDGSAAHPGMVAYVETLSRTECLNLLALAPIGRVGVVVDGEPVILPVNFALDGDSVLFRTTDTSVLNQASMNKVAFEVDHVDSETRGGWSVLIRGRADDIADAIDATSVRLRRLELFTWAPGARHHWYVIRPHAITGRRVRVIPAEL